MLLADWETGSLLITILFYVLAAVLFWLAPSPSAGNYRRLAARAGLICHAAAIILRGTRTWQVGRHLPMASQFELASLVVFLLVLSYLILERQQVFAALGAYVMPLAAGALAYAAYLPREIQPLGPSLRTYWLKIHVSSAILAYTAFALAAVLSLMYLVAARRGPEPESVDLLSYRVVQIGFVFMTLLLISGIFWAKVAWNRYFGWDAKEIWASMTWLAYAVLLYGRRYRSWRGRLAALMVLFGFASVMFTYVGVRYLNSIHSY